MQRPHVPQRLRGTCYKATGWKAIGSTAGFKRVAQDFYELHKRPKQLFVCELAKHGPRTLRERHPVSVNHPKDPTPTGVSSHVIE